MPLCISVFDVRWKKCGSSVVTSEATPIRRSAAHTAELNTATQSARQIALNQRISHTPSSAAGDRHTGGGGEQRPGYAVAKARASASCRCWMRIGTGGCE